MIGSAIGGVVKPIAKSLGNAVGSAGKTVGQGLKSGVQNSMSKTPQAGFAGGAYKAGFIDKTSPKVLVDGKQVHTGVDIKAAVKHFDTLKKTKGLDAAKAHFGDHAPNWLAHRDGVAKIGDGLAAVGIAGTTAHAYNAKHELLPPEN